jgi:hypothetical protein
MSIKKILLLCAGAAILWVGPAAGQDKKRIVVMNLKTSPGISDVVSPAVNEFFVAFITNLGNYNVMDGKTVADILTKNNSADLLACQEMDCLFLLGAGLDAREVLAGELVLANGQYEITLRLVDVKDEKLLKGFRQTYTGSEFGLVDELDGYLKVLFGAAPLAPTATELFYTPPKAQPVDISEPVVRSAAATDADADSDDADADSSDDSTGMVKRLVIQDKLPWFDEPQVQTELKPGEFELFSWSAAKGKYFIYQGGGSYFLTGDFPMVDYVNLGYQNKHLYILVDLKMGQHHTVKTEAGGYKQTTDSNDVFGVGIKLGYELCNLFNRLVIITPGVNVGYYKYKHKIDVKTWNNWTLGWDTRDPMIENLSGYFGAQINVDIGKRILNDKLGVYGYAQLQLLYVSDVLTFTNVGIKLSY